MLGTTAVELQALPIQPLDGNNSPLPSTDTDSFISCCYAWFCAPVCPFSLCQFKSTHLWSHSVCVCVCVSVFSFQPCKHLHLSDLSQGGGTPTSFVLQMTAVTHHTAWKHAGEDGDGVIMKRRWDHHFTRGAGILEKNAQWYTLFIHFFQFWIALRVKIILDPFHLYSNICF